MNLGSNAVADTCGVALEAAGFRQDALDMAMQYGTPITIRLRKETDVTRDDLSTIKKKSLTPSFQTWAFPVERQPDTRKLEKAGIREEVDVLIYTPILSWIESNYISDENLGDEFSAIDTTRSTVLLDGQEFKIADKGLSQRVGAYPVYITFGLRRT